MWKDQADVRRDVPAHTGTRTFAFEQESRHSIHPGGDRCTEHSDVLSEAYAAGGSNARLSQPGVCRSPV